MIGAGISWDGSVYTVEEHNIPVCEPGSKVVFPNGDTFRYVKAQAAKTKGLAYGIDENYEVSSTGIVKTGNYSLIGFPVATTSAPASGYTYKYFWIQTAGNLARVETSAAVADNAQVYTTATAGKLDDGDASGAKIVGMKFTTAAGSATNTTAFLANEVGVVAA